MKRLLFVAALFIGCTTHVWSDDVRANRTLRIGDILAPGDLRVAETIDPARLKALVGKEVRRAIYVGRPIADADLGPPTLVNRNDIVVMTYKFGGLAMRTEGRALGRGGVGEAIYVMTLSSRQKVRATVVARGQVKVR